MPFRISLLVLSLVVLAACAPRQQVVDNVFISASQPNITIEPAEGLTYLGSKKTSLGAGLATYGGVKRTVHVFAEADAESWVKKLLLIASHSIPPTYEWKPWTLSVEDGFFVVGERELGEHSFQAGTTIYSIPDWASSTGLFENRNLFTYYLCNHMESRVSSTHTFLIETCQPLPAVDGWTLGSLDYYKLPQANREIVDEFFAAGLEGFATIR